MPIREGTVSHFVTHQPDWSPSRWKGRKRFEARIAHQPVYTYDELKGSLLCRAEQQDFPVKAGTRETTTGLEVVWLTRVEMERAS